MHEVDEGLKFDEETHTYTVGGEVLPSVTQILKAARLIDYSMIPQPILQAAARRGRAVHQVLELLDNDLLDPASEIDGEIAGYVGAAIQFYRDTQFEPHLVEFRSYHRTYRYAGTLDRTGIMAGQQRTIVDFKTGIILPGHALQLAAYLAMLENPRSYRRIALQLNKDASYRVHEYPGSSQREDFAIFVSALSCWRFNQRNGNNDRAAVGRLF